MPICPRCGKSLSSDQALQYHLNRKYKCGTWKCAKCSTLFDTKFSLKIHESGCMNERHFLLPSYDILCNIYLKSKCLFVELDNNGIIHNISPSCESLMGHKQQELIGKKYDNFLNDSDGIISVKNIDQPIEMKKEHINDSIIVGYVC